MANDEVTYLAILGFISNLPESDQEKIKECIARVKAVLAEYPDPLVGLALALIGAEAVARNKNL